MLTSGHFGNNQAGQLKVLVVLTSTESGKKKKRKVKQESASPALNHGKRIKREENVKKEDGTGNPDQAGQEANIKMKAEESFWAAPYESLTDDERETIADEIVVHEHEVALSEVEDPPDYQKFDSIPNHKGSQCSADDEDEADEKDGEQAVVPEFVRDQA
ncbi:hypothetical protein FoTM2_013422 [Fusarium oxysporum f. sp. vasinfectum]|nr:hypothetical protein FoTM2_013422 [Fusarium oxysporum f. sp. vasinfectum]